VIGTVSFLDNPTCSDNSDYEGLSWNQVSFDPANSDDFLIPDSLGSLRIETYHIHRIWSFPTTSIRSGLSESSKRRSTESRLRNRNTLERTDRVRLPCFHWILNPSDRIRRTVFHLGSLPFIFCKHFNVLPLKISWKKLTHTILIYNFSKAKNQI
jgi:hypothetical protein